MLQNKKLSLGDENKIKYIKYSGNPLLKIDELIKDITFKKFNSSTYGLLILWISFI